MESIENMNENIKREMERYKYYLTNKFPMEEIQKIKNYILNNDYLMSLYGKNSSLNIAKAYLIKICELKKVLNDKDDSQFLINCMEYLRFMCMRENIEGVVPGIIIYESLSDSKFSSLLLGKGSSHGQTELLMDLLEDRINTTMSNLSFYKFPELYNPQNSYSCLTINTNEGKKYIDIYRYNGKADVDTDLIVRNYIDNIYPYELDKKKLKKAKAKVSKYLIEKLGIKEILDSLELEGLTETEKNKKFIEYIKTHQDQYEGVEINANTIIVNGALIEASRLLELFYIASNIKYAINDQQKENSEFKVILDNQKVIVKLDKEKEHVKTK